MKPVWPILFFFLLALFSAGLLVFKAKASFSLPDVKLPQFTLSLPKFEPKPTLPPEIQLLTTPQTTVSPSKTSASPTRKPTTKTQARPTQASAARGTCYRFTVPHLDGSSSNRCYTQADYQQLISLGPKLSSAQTFYKFHLDSVTDYQKEYERTGSSIYLNAKTRAQASADAEQAKIGPLSLEMYAIEARGW